MSYILPDLSLLKIKVGTDPKDLYTQSIVFEPLSPGYGVTIGNSLRRILLSSLEGSAVSSIKIKDVTHEFSTLPGIKEDVVELILNLKRLSVKLNSEEPAILKLSKKGPAKVTAADFAKNPDIEIVDPDFYLTTLDKDGKLDLEVTVEKGRGFVPTEKKTDHNVPLGTILVDSIFTPIRKVHYEVENTRVGGMTNYDKLTLEVTTDGSISPLAAVKTAGQILTEHLIVLTETAEVKAPALKQVSKPKSAAGKAVKSKKTAKAKTLKKK